MKTSKQQQNRPVKEDEAIYEWLASFDSVIIHEGKKTAKIILENLALKAFEYGLERPFSVNTPYRNTIAPNDEPTIPGDSELESRINAIIRWNALILVIRANLRDSSLGGHLSSFLSISTLYDVGFNEFFRGKNHSCGGDLIYFQGHSSPGIYARSYLEGRISIEQLDTYRQESLQEGLSSYPHPRLMQDYWEFPTVSMGLGPLQAIYQAYFMKYLENHKLIEKTDRKVWAFIGDGESDEPETLAQIAMAGREKLDNLIFVVNCNLQRLDGPVRGNGKIIQELEGRFKGSEWNVIKVIWGENWDPLLEKDHFGLLQKRMEEVVDGDYQNYKSKGGRYVRDHFFGVNSELKSMVEHMSDEDIYHLRRGGLDKTKVYAAYHKAFNTKGKPTVILAKTIKGYGSEQIQAKNEAHQIKKINVEGLLKMRDRYNIPLNDEQVKNFNYYSPHDNSLEKQYILNKREKMGGFIPTRIVNEKKLNIPDFSSFESFTEENAKAVSTTMVTIRILNKLLKDPNIGKKIVPIIPDEARTFGMEGMFKQYGIYTSEGQKYTPQDAEQIMYYREDVTGQILEEGINEAGAFTAWMTVGSSKTNYNTPMIPMYLYYSMFGFQRIGDLAWAAGDLQCNGFLFGAVAGKTTLAGEGLQHCDGHSHILANTIPNCISYDPAFSYELAVIMHNGLDRMYQKLDDVYFYITIYNDNYAQPEMPQQDNIKENIIKGLYKYKSEKVNNALGTVQLIGSGPILNEIIKASQKLKNYKIASEIYSATSFNELARDGQNCDRYNLLNIEQDKKQVSHVEKILSKEFPVIAATDYNRVHAEQIRAYIPTKNYNTLGTDGFGRSDGRENLRKYFEVDADFIAYTSLVSLLKEGKLEKEIVLKAQKDLNIDQEKVYPLYN